MQADRRTESQPSIAGEQDAQLLVARIIAVMEALQGVVSRETDLLKSYKLREAASLGEAKTEAARQYVHALDLLKSNAIALARWAPSAVARLKKTQAALADALSINMAVLATARSVSEGIIRNLAADVAAPRMLNTYGAGGRAAAPSRPAATPLMVSKSL
jgi:hypothetical protein